jgi:tetratricopeptide (TPR) repeat protein
MNRDSYLLLTVGVLVGFIATYMVVRDRDLGPIVIRDALVRAPAPSAEEVGRELQRIQELEAQLIETPDDFQLLVDLANLYFEIESFPEDLNLRTDMATALYHSNQVDKAIVEFEASLAIAPNHPQALFNMGVILLEERGDREGAIELWEQLIRMNPSSPQRDLVQTEIDRLRGGP